MSPTQLEAACSGGSIEKSSIKLHSFPAENKYLAHVELPERMPNTMPNTK
jgi:hypothetical protein